MGDKSSQFPGTVMAERRLMCISLEDPQKKTVPHVTGVVKTFHAPSQCVLREILFLDSKSANWLDPEQKKKALNPET